MTFRKTEESEKPKEKRWAGRQISFFLILFSCLIFLAMTGVIAWNSYRLYQESYKRYSGDLCTASNAEIAYAIDGDLVERFAQTLTVDDEYEKFAQGLTETYNKIEDIKYLYILFDNGVPGMYTYIYDATHSQEFPGEAYALGRNETVEEYLEAAEVLATGQTMTEAAYYNSTYGELYYAYAPIFNSDGEVVAFLGTDINIEPMHARMRQYAANITIVVFLAFVCFLLIYMFMTREILAKPMRWITDSAVRLSRGDLNLNLPDSIRTRRDEIGQMGAAFENVAHSVSGVMSDIDRLSHAVRSGYLRRRAASDKYEGEYHHIIVGINKTMDAQCRHFDNLEESVAFFGGPDRSLLYGNLIMLNFLERHGLDADDQALLTKIVFANADGETKDRIREFLRLPGTEPFLGELCLAGAEGAGEYFYTMSISHIDGTDDEAHSGDGGTGIILLLSDVTPLIRARKGAEQASQAKSEFLSRMSHEMRTPMNAIIGMTNIAKSSDDPEKKEYCLDKIQNASSHLLGVINDILDMSKIEANKFELSCCEFSFEKMLINVTNVVNFKAEEKELSLFVNMAQDIPPMLYGDELRLSQIITNLFSNAIKFTPAGGMITLNAAKTGEQEGVCTLRLEVIDSGIGISKEHQTRLFHSFEQADGGIARQYGGTGLGLAICKKIVELMGGEIWVESEPGKGSKFSFTVRLKKGEDQPAPKTSLINRENLRILAVDDSADVRAYFRHIMQSFRLPCDVAADGSEALELIRSAGDRPYNIIFVDWMMPDINGVELTKRIKEIMRENAVIIMISVADWSTIEAEATRAGVSRFISKPLFPSVLMNTINEILGNVKIKKRAQETQARHTFQSRTILLAEDVDINREILFALLDDTGIDIEAAQNGEEAVRLFRENPQRYSLILMDIQMPKMDGYEATRRIRALETPEAGSVPIVAMTANVFREDVERCLAAGMNAHVGKPIDQEELFNMLEKYLTPESDAQASGAAGAKADAENDGGKASLPVIDPQDGMRRLMNNEKLYHKLLNNFLNGNTVSDLFESLEAGDAEKLRLSAHSLKGVSANLGLPALNAISAQIEALAKEGQPAGHLEQALRETSDVTAAAISELLAGAGK